MMRKTICIFAAAMVTFLLMVLPVMAAFAADLPDAKETPGAINPDVTQENISTTICVPGWTVGIRPSVTYTNKLKRSQLNAGVYASTAPPAAFEEDHLISLELGGHPKDPRNLWPQLWAGALGAHAKDRLENYLRRAVCAGAMPLKQAQDEVAADWIAAYHSYIQP